MKTLPCYAMRMGRAKGSKKTGGRSKGTPNKRTDDLLNLLEEFKYNPVRSLLEKYPTLSVHEQTKIDLKIMDHVYPKLKEQHVEIESPQLIQDEFDSMSEEELQQTIDDMRDYWDKEFAPGEREAYLRGRASKVEK